MTLPTYRCLLDLPATQLREMTDQEATVFLRIGYAIKHKDDRFIEGLAATVAKHSPAYRVGFARLVAVGAPVDPALATYAFTLCSSFGEAVMWSYSLALMAFELKRAATLDDFGMQYFPMGVPTKQGYDAAWVAQKRYGHQPDNWLDVGEQWPKFEKVPS